MEAMKMENELRAKSDGRSESVRVTPGTAVEKGEWCSSSSNDRVPLDARRVPR